jgi:hypothetical protein
MISVAAFEFILSRKAAKDLRWHSDREVYREHLANDAFATRLSLWIMIAVPPEILRFPPNHHPRSG